jgi:RimJ/RimL family protein N-acetyltransferase
MRAKHLNECGQPVGRPLPNWRVPEIPARASVAGRFCQLEPLAPEHHAEALYAANAEDAAGRMWTYLPYGPFASLTDYRAWMEEICSRTDPSLYAVIDRTTGNPVGVASYLRIEPRQGSIEVGHLAYSPRLQRTALATEAMFLFMRRAFDLGYRRYEWKCDALNAPSRVAAVRLGFTFEGVFRQATVVKKRNRDTAWYSVTDQEWPALRNAYERWLHPDNFDPQGRQRLRLSELTAAALRAVPDGRTDIEV